MKKIYLFVALCLLGVSSVKSQTHQLQSSWVMWVHNHSLSAKNSINLDLQVRSNEQFDGIKNFLIRPSFNHSINKNLSATLGYSYFNTQVNATENQKSSLSENMIWEQFSMHQNINNINVISRIRLEQRFIEQQSSNIFTQRIRFFVRTVIPITKSKPKGFNKGTYIALQEEAFFNVQNKNKLNTHFYDQNRISLNLGYKFNQKVNLEVGYLHQSIHRKLGSTNNNIFQIVLFTKFKNK
ncbi:DUF2490 domain-containing protein [Pedobacter cryophilus]|uniref:DUF2490 domain-containing protein n=1 Tax=Pedobacter cryophilus TaxID=2571271 RepID=A0A4U1BWZ3_9SPHI|nr:DUF2490 domain-containing protein [Pedobacter cryophilus]TKB95943.1 DUF2490 domain-containing protein [Pedobacter cryophilus]